MATIRKRTNTAKEVSYHVQVRLKGYPTQTASFERITDARKWASSTESAIREGRHFKTSESKKHTLADLIQRYNEQIVPHKKNRYNDIRHMKFWNKEIGLYLLSEVTSSMIVECRDKLRTPRRADSTVNRYMTSLSHALTIAVNEWEWIDHNPCSKIKKLKEPRGRIRLLSDEERERLLDECRNTNSKDLYDAVILALATGASRSEIMNMEWKQVDFRRQVITLFETKNNEIRLLPISGLSFDILEKRSRIRRIDTNLVFPSEKNAQKPIELRISFEDTIK